MRALLRSFGTLVLVLAVYYAAPVGETPRMRRHAEAQRRGRETGS